LPLRSRAPKVMAPASMSLVRGKGLAAEQGELAFPRGIDPFANIRPYPAFKDRYKDGSDARHL
jgi:hypothetical protein